MHLQYFISTMKSFTFRIMSANGYIVHDEGNEVHQQDDRNHDKCRNQQIIIFVAEVVQRRCL